jgi:hypothetical protein
VNVSGLARLTQLVLSHMRQKHAGKIVNVSSMGGKIWESMGSWYHATKFAVEGLSDSSDLSRNNFPFCSRSGSHARRPGGVRAASAEGNLFFRSRPRLRSPGSVAG